MLRHFFKDQRGTSVIELALVAPMLALMLVGMVDLSRGFGFQMKLERTAKAASERALTKRPVDGDTSFITDAAKAAYGDDPNFTSTATLVCECPDGTEIACNTTCASGRKTTYLNVTTTDSYEPLLGYLGLPDQLDLSGRAVLRLQ